MWPFGKKKEREETALTPEEEQVRRFAQQFDPEEFTILAVTGPNGIAAGKEGDDPLWNCYAEVTAWMDEGDDEVHQGPARLVILADDALREYLRHRVPGDFILKVKVRQSKEDDTFQMLGAPEPAFDPELKAILEEQKKPVSHYLEGLGTFALNRSVGWFQADVDWLGTSIQLTFDQDENLSACADAARTLMADQDGWDARVRQFAAGELLELANQWAADGAEGGEEPEEITAEQFARRMELESIQVYADGSFAFWFNDGDLFWGHSIHVSGSLEDGPTDAEMEG